MTAPLLEEAQARYDKHHGVKAKPEPLLDVMAALSQWKVTDEQVELMEATRIIWRDAIALGHLGVWCSAANGGKSALARFAAGELAHREYHVLYLNEDAGAGDLPAMHEHAKQHRYTLLNSTLTGSSPDAQLDVLNRLVHDGADLNGYVLIFDTLKKYVDLMSKGGSRAFFRLMRALTQRGATIILLAHTNKHIGLDGKPMFEGVGDVRNDVDELFYLDATDKDERGIRTLTLRPDKTRCAVKAVTFMLDTTDMTMRALDRVIDVQEMERTRRQQEQDREVIDAIDEALLGGGMNRTELIELASTTSGHGAKSVRKVLDRYCSEDTSDTKALWMVTNVRVNNSRYISRKPGRLPPLPNRQTAEPFQPAEPAEPTREEAWR